MAVPVVADVLVRDVVKLDVVVPGAVCDMVVGIVAVTEYVPVANPLTVLVPFAVVVDVPIPVVVIATVEVVTPVTVMVVGTKMYAPVAVTVNVELSPVIVAVLSAPVAVCEAVLDTV